MNRSLLLSFTSGILAMAYSVAFADTYDLLAGQSIDVGDVVVEKVGSDLLIDINLDSPWVMTKYHIAVDDTTVVGDEIPVNLAGNPAPGQFPIVAVLDPPTTGATDIPVAVTSDGPFNIAVHANVEVRSTHVLDFFSGPTSVVPEIQVVAGVNPLVDGINLSYPQPAVAAWEAFNDPLDTGPSFWDANLSGHAFSSFSDWIWETYRVVNWNVSQTVTFEHILNVPGVPTGGQLWITCDNFYVANLNNGLVGADFHATPDNWWKTVESYPLNPVSGSNTLQILATNYGNSSYTQYSNPAGLRYEGFVNYYTIDQSETGWGAGTRFTTKSWATFFVFPKPL